VLGHADRARGKFRAFLLTSLKHYAANEHVRAAAGKRGGGEPLLSFDLQAAEGRYGLEPRDDLTPERLYDRRWAVAVLERALRALRAEFRAHGREPFFEAVQGTLIGDVDAVPYREIADRLGMTESNVKVTVHRMRRRYGDLVRAEIADAVETEEAVDDELRYLLTALGEARHA
jgi:RNA polymerase sigma-70 factor (ECF subfamily)